MSAIRVNIGECAVEDCPKDAYCLGWCKMHYTRWERNGTTELKPRILRSQQTCVVEECYHPVAVREWCSRHYQRVRRYGDPNHTLLPTLGFTLEERFFYYVAEDGPIPRAHPELGPCLPWTGGLTNGYGAFNGSYAHRFLYELAFGPIPSGLEVTHLCHAHDDSCPGGETCFHRRCCNPEHLEAVAPAEKTARSRVAASNQSRRCTTHCRRGHRFTPENTYYPSGSTQRHCKTCLTAARLVQNHIRRARLLGAFVEAVHPLVLAERDNWICGICQMPIDPLLTYPNPGYRSIDHIIPLSRGGEHSYTNTRIAHLSCNNKRRTAKNETFEVAAELVT